MADRHDDLGALDFSYGDSASHDDGPDPLDFVSGASDSDPADDLDALTDYAPVETDDSASALDAIDSAADLGEEAEDESGPALFTVINPPETVSVSAAMDGSIQRVDLSPKVTGMTEDDLAAEILVIADLARQKGLAAQHAFVVEQAAELDPQGETADLSAFLSMPDGLHLPTPEQAGAAEAEVFATRYTAAD